MCHSSNIRHELTGLMRLLNLITYQEMNLISGASVKAVPIFVPRLNKVEEGGFWITLRPSVHSGRMT